MVSKILTTSICAIPGCFIVILWPKGSFEMSLKHFRIIFFLHCFLIIIILVFFVIFRDIFLWFQCRFPIILFITFSLTSGWLIIHFLVYGDTCFVIILAILHFHFWGSGILDQPDMLTCLFHNFFSLVLHLLKFLYLLLEVHHHNPYLDPSGGSHISWLHPMSHILF